MPPTAGVQAGDERVQTSVERMQVGALLLAVNSLHCLVTYSIWSAKANSLHCVVAC